jgi:hypothetical protein
MTVIEFDIIVLILLAIYHDVGKDKHIKVFDAICIGAAMLLFVAYNLMHLLNFIVGKL